MNGVDPFLIEAVFDDVSQDLLNRNQEVIPQAPPDFVLGGKALEDGIHAQQIFDPVFDRDFDFWIFHVAERRSDWSPANRKTWATSGATLSRPKLLPEALAVLLASMQRWTKAEAP